MAGAAGLALVVVLVLLPSRLWPYVIAGISDGAIYSLAALGLVLTYKTSGIFNFAIGTQAAASAYLFYTLRNTEHLPWPLAALLALVVVGLVGSLVLERIAFWLADAPPIMRVVATIGMLVLIQSVLTAAYGEATIPFKAFLPTKGIHLGSVAVSGSEIIVTLLAVAATAGLYLFFKKHRVGVAMQALVDDPDLLALDAINPVLVRRYAWAIGSCFISISGMLVAPVLGVDVNEMLLLYITAFGAAALGFFSSLPITFAAAMGIGIAMNVMSYGFAGQSNTVVSELYTQVPFLTLAVALLLIPRRKLLERGERRVRRLSPIRPVPTRVVVGATALAVAVAFAFPAMVGQVDLNQYTTGLGFAIVFASLGLLVWTSGQISLCQMAFAAVGAATFAHAQHAGIPWLLALLLAGLVAVPVGALAAVPSFRLSGVYLAVATFGLGLLLQNLVYSTFLMFGSSDFQTVKRPVFPGLHLSTDEGYFYLSLVVAALCALLIVVIRRTRLGRLLRALADSPSALNAHAANTRVTRLYVFCIAAFMAGIGGAIIAGVTRNASGQATGAFGYFNSLAIVAVLAFCWRRPILSPLVGAFIFEVIKIYKPFNQSAVLKYEGVAFGLLALAVAVLPALSVRLRDGHRHVDRLIESPVSGRREQFVAKRAYT
jgi:branched-subunit amino acid ABC-type transport system permease component